MKIKIPIELTIFFILVFIVLIYLIEDNKSFSFINTQRSVPEEIYSVSNSDSIRVMTYNIAMNTAYWKQQYNDDIIAGMSDMVQYIVDQNVDIVGLPEFLESPHNDYSHYFIRHLNARTGDNWDGNFVTAFNTGANHNGILILSRLPIIRKFGTKYIVEGVSPVNPKDRSLAGITVETPIGEINVIVNHPPHGDPNCNAGAFYLPYYHNYIQPNQILLGDFNATRNDPCYRDIMATNLYKDTCDPAIYPSCNDTVTSDAQNYAIDYIFYTKSSEWKIDNVWVDNTRTKSDHFPVIADISLDSSVCGNNIIEGDEVCDGSSQSCNVNGYTGSQSCNSDCTGFDDCVSSQLCGDGIKNGNEQCDDGNSLNNDYCSNSCVCGSRYHYENDICVLNTRSCIIQNGAGIQIYVNGVWETCQLQYCYSGYHQVNNECVIDEQMNQGDINGDGVVNIQDVIIILNNWGQQNSPYDTNSDGVIDIQDLIKVLENWG